VTNFLKTVFKVLLLFLIIISLYPGSLLGFFLYGDLGKQPNIIENPFGTTINHFAYYFFLSLLGFFIYIKSKNFTNLLYLMFFLSIMLEVMHLFVPKRSFQLEDLLANILGVMVAYFVVKIYLLFNKNEQI
jgi:VanZ family protein